MTFMFSLSLSLGGLALAADWSCVANQPACQTVTIVHDGWHAAIVLRRGDVLSGAPPELADFPEAEFVEFSWGDRNYFPNPNSGVLAALRAAFWSGGSILHLVGFSDTIEKFYPGAKMTELRLNDNSYRRLVTFISQTFARPRADIRANASPGLFAYSRFYPAHSHFSILRTCNSWVAEALAAAGAPVSPRWVITSGNLADELEALSKP